LPQELQHIARDSTNNQQELQQTTSKSFNKQPARASTNNQQELQQTTSKNFNINFATTGERTDRGTTSSFQRTRGEYFRHSPY
jgi:hypothetical protein